MLSFPAQPWQSAKKVATLENSRRSFAATISSITPRLYLSGYMPASNAEQLTEQGITHVVSVLNLVPDIPPCIPDGHQLHIRVEDRGDEDIAAHFELAIKFIRSSLEENETNKVLVHCVMGVSRSATIVCAYLIATTGMNAIDSIEFVQTRRRIVCPNLGFRCQLELHAAKYGKAEVVAPVNWSKRVSSRLAGQFQSLKTSMARPSLEEVKGRTRS
ncbi:hypothetical protein HGRIS_002188 [Hohenbuehelia grisea]|uniref:Protein-tyrosine-phosphatase n=1 Tax=Hohenbuehelia grisea TaxID=104357 RepID=A0ABR3JJS3_9AGAR